MACQPKEFQFNTDEVFIRKEGEDVILSPRPADWRTDTCSYIMKRSNQTVIKRLPAVSVADVCISVITKSELLYGVEVSPRRGQDATALRAFLPHVEALEFPDAAATHYAAQARSRDLRLVTNNTGEFGRVKGLTLENWTQPARRPRPRGGE